MHHSAYKDKILKLAIVFLGNALYALTVKLFLLPVNLATGGTTGIGLALSNTFHISLSAFVLGFNIVMLIIGYLILGKEFAYTTVISTFAYPLSLEIFDRLLGNVVLTQDVFLCTVFTGLGIGASLGIVIKAGASTGGMDIPPLVLNKLFKIPVAVSLYVFDVIILLAQWFHNTPENILYGIVLVMIYSIVLDRMLLIGESRIEVKVVSKKYEEIRKAIQLQADRGVTMFMGKGGYLAQNTEIVMTVISRRELALVERIIHQTDPEAFMIVAQVTEVSGRGFTMAKEHR